MDIIPKFEDLDKVVPADMMAKEKLPPLDDMLDPCSLTRPMFSTIPRI